MDIETEAKAMGWIPKEAFKGDPAKWTDAEAYVSRGKELMPILRKNNENLSHKVEATSRELAAMRESLREANEAMEAFREFHNETSKREYNRALADLKAGKVAARKEGDVELEVEIDTQITDLAAKAPKEIKAPEKKDPAPNNPALDPEYVAWSTENNDWLGKDQAKTAYASSVAAYVRAMEPTLKGRAFLDKVKEEVFEKFPEEEEKESVPPSKVAPAGRNGGGNRSAHSYANLPADAKAACDNFAKRLVGPNKAFKDVEAYRKDYVIHYDWS